jgi:hypothetical protein
MRFCKCRFTACFFSKKFQFSVGRNCPKAMQIIRVISGKASVFVVVRIKISAIKFTGNTNYLVFSFLIFLPTL